jgi:hypothetical protein
MNQHVLKPEMFVSYSSSDRSFVEQLVQDLARHGITVWYDRWAMGPGDKLLEKLGDGLQHCRYFGVVLSRKSLESRWVQHELDAALIRFIEDKSVRIIPILIGRVDQKEIPISLRSFIYSDFRNLRKDVYAKRLQELVHSIVIPLPTKEPSFTPKSITGPAGRPLEAELLCLATDPDRWPKDPDDLASRWPSKYCRAHRVGILAATDYLINQEYKNCDAVENLIQCLHAIFATHEMPLRDLPPHMLRIIDDDEYDEDTRGIAIHVAGELDYPLGEPRIVRLLSRRSPKVIYSVCEYLEYRVGVLESEEIAKGLLAVLNRPDSLSYFTATHRDSDKEVEGDIRYYAARCLALSELSPEMERAIVEVIRAKYPEVEDETTMMTLNSVVLGVTRSESRLWKRYSGKIESVFDRVDKRSA